MFAPINLRVKGRASLIAAIMHVDPPPVSLLKPVTPPVLERIIRKCLAKNPDERWQTAKDLADELRWISDDNQPAAVSFNAPPQTAQPALLKQRWALTAAALLFLTTALLLIVILLHREPRTFGMVRMQMEPPERNVFHGGIPAPQFAISRDGRILAFAGRENGKVLMWVRAFDSPVSQPLTETTGGELPFWSPDGRYIGFFADSKLKKVEVTGGAPVTLTNIQSSIGEGGTWNENGAILYSAGVDHPIFRVPENGGEPAPVTKLDDSREVGHVWPQFLPDGRHFIYLSQGKAPEPSGIYVASLDGEAPKLVVPAQVRAAYASGYLLFVRESVLLAQPFDLNRLQLTGEPVRAAEQIAANTGSGRAAFAVSESGVLSFRTNANAGFQQLFWFDRNGKASVQPPRARAVSDARFLARRKTSRHPSARSKQ
jgi:hypothetical protein